jgi:hypothetical protein
MVGTQPLPGLHYRKAFRGGGSKELPVGDCHDAPTAALSCCLQRAAAVMLMACAAMQEQVCMCTALLAAAALWWIPWSGPCWWEWHGQVVVSGSGLGPAPVLALAVTLQQALLRSAHLTVSPHICLVHRCW